MTDGMDLPEAVHDTAVMSTSSKCERRVAFGDLEPLSSSASYVSATS